MLRLCLIPLCAALLLAQDKDKEKKIPMDQAPAEVNAALTARIKQFYQAHVDGKYRLADQLVAEESKDAFFAMAKPKYLGYEIVRVNYTDKNFNAAEAVVSCQANWFIRGENLKMNMPATSQWKVIDGQWYIYFPPVNERVTPFGIMHNNANSPDSKGKGGSVLPADPRVLAQRILDSVKADKTELMLSSWEPSTGEIKIANGMQGPITLSIDLGGGFPGLSYTVDKKEIKAGEIGVVKFVCDPQDRTPKPTLNASITVSPTNQVFPVKLMFAIPPEIMKVLPKGAPANK
ncbi:MAG: hypothetical protein JSU00_04665 [Acidobacteria bacterium]|nr:hypothetical protein [Acidobacteriota bacterium]